MKKKEVDPEVRENPEIDESQLTPAQLEELHAKPNYVPWIVFLGVIVTLMIACVVVILCLEKK